MRCSFGFANWLLSSLVAAALWATSAPAMAQALSAADEAVHNELRALRDKAVEALAKRDVDALMGELSDQIFFTAMNNEAVHGIEEARAYVRRMMVGSESVVQDMSVTIEPDVLSALHNDGQTAIDTGNSVAHFKLRGGMDFTLPLRWSATLVREAGAWKIASLHFSANVFDNPLEGPLLKYLWVILAVVGIVALGLGFLVGRLRRAR